MFNINAPGDETQGDDTPSDDAPTAGNNSSKTFGSKGVGSKLLQAAIYHGTWFKAAELLEVEHQGKRYFEPEDWDSRRIGGGLYSMYRAGNLDKHPTRLGVYRVNDDGRRYLADNPAPTGRVPVESRAPAKTKPNKKKAPKSLARPSNTMAGTPLGTLVEVIGFDQKGTVIGRGLDDNVLYRVTAL